MTIPLKKIAEYYTARGIWDTPFKAEAQMLAHAKVMLRMLDALVVREAFSTRRGTADLIICKDGRFIAAELKDDIGAPSPQQLSFIESVRKAGGWGAVVNTLEELALLTLGKIGK